MRTREGACERGVLWPASFPDAPKARATVHALAVQVIMIAVFGAYITFYWADDPQVDGRSRATALSQGGCMMAAPVLLMCVALSRAVRGRHGTLQWVLTALAWATALATTPLLVVLTSVMNDSDYCTGLPPRHPLAGFALPASLLATLAAGSAGAWVTRVVSRRRAQAPVLYTVRLITAAVTVFVTLAPFLHSAQTCGPAAGAEGIPGALARGYPW
ncbi:hypothetical protein [Streptomyces sp. NPDC020362]|uniref:hypothetical protein n=1 Tax=unclassified Streptomyces TaxID=2593676 RepID=UPI000AE7EBD6